MEATTFNQRGPDFSAEVNARAEAVLREWASQPKKRYVLMGGTRCPCCEAEAVEQDGHPQEVHPGILDRPTRCVSCGARWTEVFLLSTVKDVQPPSPRRAATFATAG